MLDENIAAFLLMHEDALSVEQSPKGLSPDTVWHRKLGTRFWTCGWVHGPGDVNWTNVRLKNGRTQRLGDWLKENGYDSKKEYEQPKGDCSMEGIIRRLVALESRVGILEDR